MGDQGIGSEDTVAAPPSEQPIKHATTKRESDPLVAKPAGSVTRASSPSLERGPAPDDYPELLPVDPAHYKVVREIARGGMGRILEVRDRRLGRNVAIKEVIQADESGLARFEREVAITARLQHPAIVHVHEAGRWPDGKPFYVMKLIRGKPLDARIAVAKSLAERLELLSAVITVVDALAYAHSEQVIHRDLKPANVLVGDFGETIVIDWGIAKAIGDTYDPVSIDPDRAHTTETIAGAVIGTPSYMPPEQAAGDRVDARADVYSLGAMLYQVLAGKPPFVGRTTAEVLAKVLDDKPPALAEIDPEIPADLIAIVEKAMARDPADRFPTANEMAIELKRFQQGKLIASRQYTRWELAKRWLYRYRAPVAVAVVALATLGVIGALGLQQIFAEKQRADEKAIAATAKADEGVIEIAAATVDRDPTAAVEKLRELSRGSSQWDIARLIAADAAARGMSQVLTAETGEAIFQLVFSPDGKLLAQHGATGQLRIWDLRTRSSTAYLPAQRMFAIQFASNDQIVGVDFDANVWKWTVGNPQGVKVRAISGGEFDSGALSPDATKLVVFKGFVGAKLVDLVTGGERDLGNYASGAWSLDGTALALANRGGSGYVDRLDVATGAITRWIDHSGGRMLAASDSTQAYVAHYGSIGRGKILDRDGFAAEVVDAGIITHVLALPRGFVVATDTLIDDSIDDIIGNYKGTLRSVDPSKLVISVHSLRVFESTRVDPIVLSGHQAKVGALGYSRTGILASGDERGAIRVWRLPTTGRRLSAPGAVNRATLSSDRRRLAVSRRGPMFDVHDLFSGTVKQLVPDNAPPPATSHGWVITFSSSGRISREEYGGGGNAEVITLVRAHRGDRFATLDQTQRVTVWDLAAERAHILVEEASHVAISPSGERLVTMSTAGLQLWDLATERPSVITEKLPRPVSTIAVGDSGIIIVGLVDGTVVRFAPGTPATSVTEIPHRTRVLALSHDGAHVAGGGDDAVVWLWDLRTGQLRSLFGHTGTVIALAFSPDGKHLASTSADRDVRVWSLAEGASITCSGHKDIAPVLVFDDPNTVISSGLDRTARICDTRTGRSRRLGGASAEIVFAAHVAAGSRVVVVDRFGGIVEHADNLPYGESLLRIWLDAATNLLN